MDKEACNNWEMNGDEFRTRADQKATKHWKIVGTGISILEHLLGFPTKGGHKYGID